jgi:hypothetical protein
MYAFQRADFLGARTGHLFEDQALMLRNVRGRSAARMNGIAG